MKSWLCGTSSVRRVPCWKRMFWQLKWSVNIQKYTSLDLLLTIYRKYMRIASVANNTGDNHNNIPTGLWVFVLWSAASWHHILLSTHSLTSPLLWPRVSRPDTPPPNTNTLGLSQHSRAQLAPSGRPTQAERRESEEGRHDKKGE